MSSQYSIDRQDIPVGVLKFRFRGRCTVADTNKQFTEIVNAIHGSSDPQKLILDLYGIDPVNNIAGRLWDLAVHCRKEYKLEVEFRIPENVYDDLQSSSRELPLKTKLKNRVLGVSILLLPPIQEAAPVNQETPPIEKPLGELLSCTGKIRQVEENDVILSLFTIKGEIIAKIEKRQFPPMKLNPGGMIKYIAKLVKPGETSVSIQEIPKRRLSTNRILELWDQVVATMPDDES